ncbi:unnamed protein product [Adineta ricciae]|uniref:Uncharacterized protein n=1 Tax=Adineta ricciae TaxID=249248 RepID=A0A816AI13_ADIRI|nr:unnamed protein product [Adineta ricciae]
MDFQLVSNDQISTDQQQQIDGELNDIDKPNIHLKKQFVFQFVLSHIAYVKCNFDKESKVALPLVHIQDPLPSDLNNDYQMDLVVANSRTNTDGVFLRIHNQTFTTQQTYSTG